MKIVIHNTYGRFNLPDEVLKDFGFEYSMDVPRDHPELVRLIEKKTKDEFPNLVVVEVPDGVQWEVMDYDGNEWVAERHRTWHG